MLGFEVMLITAPIGVLVAGLSLPSEISTWTQVLFCVTYISLIAIPIVPLGLLGFAVEANYLRVSESMSMHPVLYIRLYKRVLGSIRLLW